MGRGRPVEARDEEDLVGDDAEEGEEGDLEPVSERLARGGPGEGAGGEGEEEGSEDAADAASVNGVISRIAIFPRTGSVPKKTWTKRSAT